MGTRGLPDIYTSTFGPAALGLQMYISGKPLLPMLQLYNKLLQGVDNHVIRVKQGKICDVFKLIATLYQTRMLLTR